MGTSFVAIGERGFWMQDCVLDLWLRLLALHIPDSPDRNSPVHVIRTNWLVASRGGFIGCVPDGIEDAIATPDGRQLVVDAINSLRAELMAAPPHIDKNFLNLLGFHRSSVRWVDDFETRKLLEVADAFMNLIDGKILSDASDASFMPGSSG